MLRRGGLKEQRRPLEAGRSKDASFVLKLQKECVPADTSILGLLLSRIVSEQVYVEASKCILIVFYSRSRISISVSVLMV